MAKLLGWHKRTFPLIEVTWVDSTSSHRWDSVEEAAKLVSDDMHSIGYLVKRDKNYIVLAQTLGFDDEEMCGKGCGFFAIPCGCIKKTRKIK